MWITSAELVEKVDPVNAGMWAENQPAQEEAHTDDRFGRVAAQPALSQTRRNVSHGRVQSLHRGHHVIHADDQHHHKEQNRPEGTALERGDRIGKDDEGEAGARLDHLTDRLARRPGQVADVGKDDEAAEDAHHAAQRGQDHRVAQDRRVELVERGVREQASVRARQCIKDLD